MKKPTPDQQKQSILDHAKKRDPRPILTGEVALMLGWWASLRDTEAVLDDMVKDGVLRFVTNEECLTFGVRHGYRLV